MLYCEVILIRGFQFSWGVKIVCSWIPCCSQYIHQGRIHDFKLGGALKKIAPSGGEREHFWGISCEKSRFYAKKIIFFPILGGRAPGATPPPPPWIHPCTCMYIVTNIRWNIYFVHGLVLSTEIVKLQIINTEFTVY